MEIIIRRAEKAESSVIMNFQLMMALETESLQLDPELTGKGVEAVFDDPSKGLYLVALINNEIIGSLMTTYEWSDWRNRTIVWIQSVFVRPEYRQSGVFRKMYAYLQNEIKDNPSIGGIRLYVDKSNTRAQSVYSQLGMNGDHYQVFEWMKDF